jgi:RNA polymerase sigma-70 factor (ECF subfamily)
VAPPSAPGPATARLQPSGRSDASDQHSEPLVVVMVDDSKLAVRAVRGDRSAFEEIVERYEKTVYNVAYRMLRDEEDAADITQMVFIKIHRKLDSYDPSRKFFSWLYRIAVNECLNYLKKRKHEVVADGDYAVSRQSPWDDVARNERSELLEGALMDLKPEHRVVIILKYFLEFSYREISDIAGIPEKTVKSRLFTARQQLRDALMGLGYRR